MGQALSAQRLLTFLPKLYKEGSTDTSLVQVGKLRHGKREGTSPDHASSE